VILRLWGILLLLPGRNSSTAGMQLFPQCDLRLFTTDDYEEKRIRGNESAFEEKRA